jgi:hypothetical protein
MKIRCTRNNGFRKDTEMIIVYFILVSFGGSEICSTSCQSGIPRLISDSCLLFYKIIQIREANERKGLKMNSKDMEGGHH